MRRKNSKGIGEDFAQASFSFARFLIAVLIISLVILTPVAYSADISQYESGTSTATTPGIFGGLFGTSTTTANLGDAIQINVVNTEPVVVRQAVLEQQSVPVFAYLQGTTLGSLLSVLSNDPNQEDPLTGTTSLPIIKNIIVRELNTSSPYISGAPRYISPSRNDFSLSNIGYLIVNLKKNNNISAIPDKKDIFGISGKTLDIPLQADIYFDLQKGSLFGIGEQQRVVSADPEEKDFFKKIQDSTSSASILGGRAYLRATDISASSARFMIYDKSKTILSLISSNLDSNDAGLSKATYFTLSPNNPLSTTLTLGSTGSPFTDNFRVRLDKIATPQSTATVNLVLNGNLYTKVLRQGEQIAPSSSWIVKEIQTPKINSNPSEQDLHAMNFNENDLKAPISDLKIQTNKIVLSNSKSGQTQTISSDILISGTGLLNPTPLKDESAKYIEDTYCPSDSTQPACLSIFSFRKLIANFPTSKESLDAYSQMASIYDQKLVLAKNPNVCNLDPLANPKGSMLNDQCNAYKTDMRNMAVYYWDKVSKIDPVKAEEAKQKIQEASTKKADEFVIQDEDTKISLVGTYIVTDKDKGSVTINIGGYEKEYFIGDSVQTSDGVFLKGYSGEKPYYYRVDSIDPSRVTLVPTSPNPSITDTVANFLGISSISLVSGESKQVDFYPVQESSRQKDAPASLIKMTATKITSKNEAYVTILPPFDSAKATTNFTLHIPIEPRPFSYTPDELGKKINETRDLLAKMDKIINNLDSVVKTWKRTCIVTFGVLVIKNSLLQGPARNVARKSVSAFYKDKCTKEVASHLFGTTANCYDHYSAEITEATNQEQQAIQSVQADLSDTKLKADPNYQKYVAAGGSLADYREYKKDVALQSLANNNPSFQKSEYYTNSITPKLGTLNFDSKVKIYDNAEAAAQKAVPTACIGQSDQTKCEENLRKEFIIDAQNPKSTTVIPASVPVIPLNSLDSTVNAKTSTSVVNGKAVSLVRVNALQLDVYNAKTLADYVTQKKADITATQSKIAGTSGPDQTQIYNQLKSDLTLSSQRSASQDSREVYVDSSNIKTIDLGATLGDSALNGFKVDLLYNSAPGTLDNGLYHKDNGGVPIQLYSSATAQFGSNQIGTAFSGNKIVAQFDTNNRPYCYPVKVSIPGIAGSGMYVQVLSWYEGTNTPNVVRLMNSGPDGKIDCGAKDDQVIKSEDVLSKTDTSLRDTLRSAVSGVRCVNDGDKVGTLDGKDIVCSKNSFLTNQAANSVECIDTMDPSDCKLLFNACDPVMCPTSRCNLGGAYTPKNGVIASGLVGSTILCTPNFPTVVVPVCLTGVLSGLNGIRSVIGGYASCLEANLKDNSNVGLCDYANSIGLCEIMWRETTSLVDLKGGVLTYLSGKLFGEPKGGGEYLTFQSSLDNVGQSVEAFTKEYSETSIAALYQGKSSGEIGSEICRRSINGKIPSIGDVLDQLTEPENPPQFFAFFDSAPYSAAGSNIGASGTQLLTTYGSQELTQYTVVYHIYAGSGIQPSTTLAGAQPTLQQASSSGVRYSVMLVNSADGSSMYVTDNPSEQFNTEYTIQSGQSAQKTVYAIGKPGYDEVCVIINGKKSCGFKKVTTDFSLDAAKDIIESSAATQTGITNAQDCRMGTSVASSKIGNTASPFDSGLLSSSIVRICSPVQPTSDVNRWTNVGTCGKDTTGADLGTCWLDRNSIHVSNTNTQASINSQVNAIGTSNGQTNLPKKVYSSTDSKTLLSKLVDAKNAMIDSIGKLFGSKVTSASTTLSTA